MAGHVGAGRTGTCAPIRDTWAGPAGWAGAAISGAGEGTPDEDTACGAGHVGACDAATRGGRGHHGADLGHVGCTGWIGHVGAGGATTGVAGDRQFWSTGIGGLGGDCGGGEGPVRAFCRGGMFML